jgi:hypothetical protein
LSWDQQLAQGAVVPPEHAAEGRHAPLAFQVRAPVRLMDVMVLHIVSPPIEGDACAASPTPGPHRESTGYRPNVSKAISDSSARAARPPAARAD